MKPFRALVVDDSPSMRRSLVTALTQLEGARCVEAADGLDGLRKFNAEPYDVVLTDINMPIMDGLKLLGHIRQGGVRTDTPVLVITTEASDEERATALGATAFLTKPIRAKAVQDVVKGLLGAAP